MKQEQNISVGGQAVIEGVMMRGPKTIAVAVRKPNGDIVVKSKPFKSITQKIKFLGLPILRGGVVLIETLVLGIKALTFSGDVAMESEEEKKKEEKPQNKFLNSLWMAVTVIISFGLGLLLFFYVPLLLTDLFHVKSGIMFNVIDGFFRLLIFLAYIYLITLLKDVKRVFEYHGAEHKSIFAFEDKKELEIASAKPYTTLHPRCGTSFLLIVMVVSIFVFIFLGKPETVVDRLIRLAFVPLIGGISYEFIKIAGKYSQNRFLQFFILPGLWLQKLTTKEPDDSQIEVALVALKSALGKDPNGGPSKVEVVSEFT